MPRYVILHHQTPPGGRAAHWDFMLESGGVLRTWALVAEPQAGPPIDATALADHRTRYLDYEGEISGGRGTVARWDQGEYALLPAETGQVSIRATGEKLRGRVKIRQIEGPRWSWRYWVE